MVESRRGAVLGSGGVRFPSPLIKPDVRISRIRLSDWLHVTLTTWLALQPRAQSRHTQFPEDRFHS